MLGFENKINTCKAIKAQNKIAVLHLSLGLTDRHQLLCADKQIRDSALFPEFERMDKE